MSSTPAGFVGLVGITVATLGVSALITLVTGSTGHWCWVIAGIFVGWAAVGSINR